MAYKLIQKFVDSLGDHPTTTVTAPMSPFLIETPWTKNLFSILMLNKGRESLCAWDEHLYHQCSEDMFRKYVEKKVSKQELEKAYYDFASQAQSLYDEALRIDFSKADEKIILPFFKKAGTTLGMVTSTIYIEILSYDMALKVIGPENKPVLDAVWERATHPTFLSFEGRRLAHLVKLIKETDDISLVIPKARYVYTDYYWTKNDSEIHSALEDIKTHLTEKEEELGSMYKKVGTLRSAHEKWEESLTSEEKFLTEYIQMIMLFRDIRKDSIAQTQALLVLIATELLKRAGIDAKYAHVLTIYECARGVEYLKSIESELVERVAGNISLMSFDSSTIEVECGNYGEAVEELYALTSKHTNDVVDTIKGQTASRGKVSGTVRIVLDPDNYKEFADGDILVTSMTRPEFISLMKRAGAIVTNEGGITCHAAIVSRELGIPCIIGTKNATRVLHDGDLVEVDADNGIVKILKRKYE